MGTLINEWEQTIVGTLINEYTSNYNGNPCVQTGLRALFLNKGGFRSLWLACPAMHLTGPSSRPGS